jgi:hypothetical protein
MIVRMICQANWISDAEPYYRDILSLTAAACVFLGSAGIHVDGEPTPEFELDLETLVSQLTTNNCSSRRPNHSRSYHTNDHSKTSGGGSHRCATTSPAKGVALASPDAPRLRSRRTPTPCRERWER